MISAVLSTPPAAGIVNASMLVIVQPSNCSGGVLVDGFDVIVELNDIDFDAVFAGPFINDLFIADGAPGHPAGVDGPADVELF